MAGKINLSRPSYVVYEHSDLDTFKKFANNFGLEEVPNSAGTEDVFFRGYGKDRYVYIARQAPTGSTPRFIGGAFCASSERDFETAQSIEGAHLFDISKWPGGGKMVVLRDPNGFEMRVIWDQEEQKLPEHGISNLAGRPPVNGALHKDKPRLGEYVRMNAGPAAVHKIGHFGYETDNYEKTVEWYTGNFNFRPTDVLYLPSDSSYDLASFFRVDLGQQYSDHHCLLITRRDKPGTKVHHSSFEVEDLDTQMMGHQWLIDAHYELVWGIGRHIHGSQVFDYWYDTDKFVIEHYADGDVVNEETKDVLRAPAGNMAVWGPPVPVIWGGKQQVSA